MKYHWIFFSVEIKINSSVDFFSLPIFSLLAHIRGLQPLNHKSYFKCFESCSLFSLLILGTDFNDITYSPFKITNLFCVKESRKEKVQNKAFVHDQIDMNMRHVYLACELVHPVCCLPTLTL